MISCKLASQGFLSAGGGRTDMSDTRSFCTRTFYKYFYSSSTKRVCSTRERDTTAVVPVHCISMIFIHVRRSEARFLSSTLELHSTLVVKGTFFFTLVYSMMRIQHVTPMYGYIIVRSTAGIFMGSSLS